MSESSVAFVKPRPIRRLHQRGFGQGFGPLSEWSASPTSAGQGCLRLSQGSGQRAGPELSYHFRLELRNGSRVNRISVLDSAAFVWLCNWTAPLFTLGKVQSAQVLNSRAPILPKMKSGAVQVMQFPKMPVWRR